MWLRSFILIVIFISGCQPVNQSLETAAQKEEVAHSDKQNSEGYNTNSNEHVKYAPNSHIRLEDIETAVKNLVEPTSEVDNKDKIQREKDDLHAQETVANYTRYMFWSSIAGLFLTAIGIYFIWRTFNQTKDAIRVASASNVSAERAAQAASASVEVARQIGQAEVRSYLSASDAEWAVDSKHIIFNIRINNIGMTPCIGGYIKIQAVVFGKGEEENITTEFNDIQIGSIPSKEYYPLLTSWKKEVLGDKFNFISDPDNKAHIGVMIWIKAIDVFGKDETHFIQMTSTGVSSILEGEINSIRNGGKLNYKSAHQGEHVKEANSPFEKNQT